MKKYGWFLICFVVFLTAFRMLDSVLVFPKHFPKPVYDFKKNPLDERKIALGRVLFYDPLLSSDNTISCASCHSSYNSFAHVDHNLSHGIDDQIGTRNAPALINLAWQKTFMWDGAVNHLDVQALAPITHPKEMGEELTHVIQKLQQSPTYPTLFYQAFGDSIITGQHVLLSLAQFQLTLISANSKYDSMLVKKAAFTPQEKNGYALFQQHCNTCHREPLFSTYAFKNNGLPVDTTLNDFGRWNITHQASDSLLFKVPTLRNLEYSYPYMHDGRFKRLSDVIYHYTNGIQKTKTLSPELQQPIKLTEREKVDLVAFLLTLSDRNFVFNPAFAYPPKIVIPSAKDQ